MQKKDKGKFDETQQEEHEKIKRRPNLIVLGLNESVSSESKQRDDDYQTAMKEMLASVKCDNLEMKQLIGLGKNNKHMMK